MTQLQTFTANSGAATQVNELVRSLSPAGLYGIDPATTTGLTLGFYGGEFNGVSVTDGTVVLTASNTNYVVAHRTTGAVTAAITTTNWLNTTTYMQLYQLVAGASTFTIATTSDKRQAYGGTGTGSTFTGGTLTSALNEAPPVTIASAATVNIGAAASNTVIVSGTTTITAFDSIAAGAIRRVRFSGILTLTHNGTSLILPAATNITTAAGDVATMESLGSGNWRCIDYARADGTALVGGGGSGTVTSVDATGGVETASGSAITGAGTIRLSELVNAQTGTTYTYLTGDRGKVVTHSNASAIAGTLPQATGTFPAGWRMIVKNKGAGTLTITPTTSTIDGAATLVLTTNQWAIITSDGTNYQALVYAPSAASLANWTEGVNSSAPNATIPVVSFLATNAATNVDAAIVAKGTGATLAQIPDNTTTGGNKRGTRSTDWQKQRSNAAMVASGLYSVIIGGRDNTASVDYSIAGGFNNTSSAQSATAIGEGNTASAAYSVALGNANSASGQAAVAIGDTNTATAAGAAAVGSNLTASGQFSFASGYLSSTRAVYGLRSHASGNFAAVGDAQRVGLVVRSNTTDATATAMTSNGSATASATNQIILPTGSAGKFRGEAVSRQNSTGDTAYFTFVGAIKNVGGTVSLVGTPTVTQDFADAGATTWALAITADNTNKCLRLTFTGEAAKTIRSVASILMVQCA